MKIIINGAGGKMGHILADMAGLENVAALIDVAFDTGDGKYHALDDFDGEADCVVDFSHHSSANAVTSYCVRRNLPVLIATTGHTPEELSLIHEAAKKIPVFMSPNMSVGVALVADIAERVARLFGDCDIEMIEAHHNQKIDVPSGTALMLAKRIQNVRPLHDPIATPPCPPLAQGRHGSEVGTHEIIFSNGLETITIRHDAKNRALFAKGALSAVKWLITQKPGLYGMKEYIAG